MYIFLFIIFLLVSAFAILLFTNPATALFTFDTNTSEMDGLIYWLRPMLKAKIFMADNKPVINVYLFDLRVYRKEITRENKKKAKLKAHDYYRMLALTDSVVILYYGLDNPFRTAMSNVIIGLVGAYLKDVKIVQNPDFVPDHDYIVIHGGTKVNLGDTLVNYLELAGKKRKRSDQYGSVQYD